MDAVIVTLFIILSVFVFYLTSRIGGLSTKIKELETWNSQLTARLFRLEEALHLAARKVETPAIPAPAAAAAAPGPVMQPAVGPRQAAVDLADAAGLPASELLETTGVVARLTGTRPQASQGPTPLQNLARRLRTTGEWEALIGGNWLNRIGALALILGFGFFLKYAFDNNWITQSLRVAMGLAFGAGLLALARYARRKEYTIFAQGLVGAGISILYLSVYASSNFYNLVPPTVALAAMAAVTVVAFQQALSYDSLAVALLAWLGGFLTPFLLHGASANEVGVIGYVLFLDLLVVAIVLRRDAWAILEPLTLGATYLTYLSWYVSNYSSGKLLIAAIALSLFWAIFYGLDVWRVVVGSPTHRTARQAIALANGAVYYLMLLALVAPSHRSWMGWITLALGAVYLGTILILRPRLSPLNLVDARYTVTAIVLLAVATGLELSGFALAIAWSVEAVAVLWWGVRGRLPYVWQPALTFYGLAAIALTAAPGAVSYAPIGRFVPLFNQRALAFLALTLALAAGAIILRPLEDKLSEPIRTSLRYGWCAVLFIGLTVETNDLFGRLLVNAHGQDADSLNFLRFMTIAALWLAYSMPLTWYGLRARVLPILTSGLGAMALAVSLGLAVGAVYTPIQRFVPVLNVRAATFALLIAGLLVQLRWLRKGRQAFPWIDTVILAFQAGIVLIGFELITAETNDLFRHRAGAAGASIGEVGLFVEFMALAAGWMMYSLFLVWYGIRKTALPVLSIGLASAGVAVGAGAVAAFAFQPGDSLPILLSVRISMVPLLIAGLFVHLRLLSEGQSVYRWLDRVLGAFQAAIVLLGFELVSAETRDFFDNMALSHPVSGGAPLRSMEQLTLSVLWLLYAIVLMAFGLWRRTRWLRLGAMGLFAFIILKIFIYDLSFLQGLYRSVSFAGLGVILLAVSYLYQRYRGVLLDDDVEAGSVVDGPSAVQPIGSNATAR